MEIDDILNSHLVAVNREREREGYRDDSEQRSVRTKCLFTNVNDREKQQQLEERKHILTMIKR